MHNNSKRKEHIALKKGNGWLGRLMLGAKKPYLCIVAFFATINRRNVRTNCGLVERGERQKKGGKEINTTIP